MKLIVTGAAGMVAQATVAAARAQGIEALALARTELDIANVAGVRALLERERPAAVINCAALTNVDACESEPARALEANAWGPENLAGACALVNAGLVHISTDYVFDGAKDGFYTQRDQPRPLGVYAHTKLEGERRAQAAWARTSIVRTGWIYGAGGKNFLAQVVAMARRGDRLRAIDDAFGTPTYAPDLALRLIELARLDLPGIYHVTNSGEGTSYFGFAEKACEMAGLAGKLEIERVAMDSLKRPAPRPRNSRLRCLLSVPAGLKPLRHWEAALEEFAGAAP